MTSWGKSKDKDFTSSNNSPWSMEGHVLQVLAWSFVTFSLFLMLISLQYSKETNQPHFTTFPFLFFI